MNANNHYIASPSIIGLSKNGPQNHNDVSFACVVNIQAYLIAYSVFRNPNSPTPLEITWPQYTAERVEYAGLGANLTVRSKMRPEKMALWNEFLPEQFLALEEPTTQSPKPATTEAMSDDNKGEYYHTQSSIQL